MASLSIISLSFVKVLNHSFSILSNLELVNPNLVKNSFSTKFPLNFNFKGESSLFSSRFRLKIFFKFLFKESSPKLEIESSFFKLMFISFSSILYFSDKIFLISPRVVFPNKTFLFFEEFDLNL